LGKPKALQVEEEKVITEYIVSLMVRIMSLIGKDIGGGGYGMPHQVVPIEGNLVGTWREIIRGKNKSLSFRRRRI
jgi:hypothetical protein